MTDIRIDDLARPVLTDAQRAALQQTAALTVELTPQAIMADAEAAVLLDDWGPNDFLPRLTLLCDEWNADTGLTTLGRLSLRSKLLQHATSRLLIQDSFNKHPEIRDINIERPIIVAGLPRSGTTHLLNLMAADRRLRSLPLWESYEPVPLPSEARSSDSTQDPRYIRCAQAWQQMQMMTPHLAAMHPMDPDHIHEELELMGPNFGSYNYEWLSFSPRWRDHYLQEDQTYQYEYMKDVLRLLTWQDLQSNQSAKRWVLKCPQHMEQLPALKKVFPDATVAITHRDPVAVIQSSITMLAYGQPLNRKEVLTVELLDYWSDRILSLLKACVRDRQTWDVSQSMDVPFRTLIRDDIGMVKTIYDLAGLPFTNSARDSLTTFAQAHSEDYGRVQYDLEGNFGVAPEVLRQRFDFYFDAFPFLKEVC